MIELFCLIVIVAILLVLYFIQRRDFNRERAEWVTERSDLNDRFAARNLTEYARVHGELPKMEPIETAHEKNIKAWRKPEDGA